jgi:TetR/AcrR family transcriptional regulator, acrAB operon repressor
MARRTREEALETRNRILDAAERVFNQQGVSHTSLASIASAAGVTRGAVYWHFRNKIDLFDAMMQRVVLPIETMLERSAKDGVADPLAELRGSTLEALGRTARDSRLQRVFDIAYHKCEYVGDAAGLRERHRASQRQCTRRIEQSLRNAIAKGVLSSSVDPRAAAIGLSSLVQGLLSNWVLDKRSFTLAATAETLIDIYLRGLQDRAGRKRRPGSLRSGGARPPADAVKDAEK